MWTFLVFSEVLEHVSVSDDERETSFLFHRLSVALQRFNAVLLHDTFDPQDDPDQ